MSSIIDRLKGARRLDFVMLRLKSGSLDEGRILKIDERNDELRLHLNQCSWNVRLSGIESIIQLRP